MRELIIAAAALCAVLGCSVKVGSDAELVKANILESPPAAIGFPSKAVFGDAVAYLGCDLDADKVTAGGSVTVTHYYKVLAKPEKGWALFTHVVGSDEWFNADQSPMRKAHPVDAWRPDQIIVDKQTIAIDRAWGSSKASITVGLFRGKNRMKIAGTQADGQGRLVACEIEVEKKLAFYTVHRASTPIEIDGRGSEESWRKAGWSDWFTTAKGGKDPVGRARARLLWDDDNLYALIEVEDTDVFSPFQGRDDTLWKSDVVELFIDADRDGRGYVELQVNPNNAVFDAWFPITRAQKHHFEWNSSLRSAVHIDGTADKRSDRDRGWTAEIAIPHTDVKGMANDMKVETPPVAGDRWRLNVIRVDKAKGSKSITASSWNPITIRDFHALSRMLTVVFAS